MLASTLLPETATVSGDGHLLLGGCDTVALAETYGTPLYVYDEATIRHRAGEYRAAFEAAYAGPSLVCYAGKAYCAPWLLRLIAELGLGLDVVSGGELYTAQASGFPLGRVSFHGNNKSPAELRDALDAGIGRIVVDNLDEARRLLELTAGRPRPQPVLLRVAPGVEAHTHAHILTGAIDTKFGLSLADGSAAEAAALLAGGDGVEVVGLHAHIGSQIFELEPYRETIERLFGLAAQLRAAHGFRLRELSPGGGFGMSYVADDRPLPIREIATALGGEIQAAAGRHGFTELPALIVEPGRSIVGPAGVALYRVGSIKDIPNVRTYVAVDGGMADNIRPTAYGAVYTPLLANRAGEPATDTVAVAGRFCESGDVLVQAARLPRPRIDDLVALPGSGAYHLAMASNYNLAPRPAVVVVGDGQARLVRRRETYADLLAADL